MMSQEDTETRLAVQEALSMMSGAFQQIDSTNLQLLEALLMQNIDKVRLWVLNDNCDDNGNGNIEDINDHHLQAH